MDTIERTSQDIQAVAGRILSEDAAPKTPGEQRRQSLIETAYRLIAESAFERLRTRDIAAQAGVNIATLHSYFARKEDLIQGVVEYLLKQFMTAHLSNSALAMKTPLEQIQGELAEMYTLLREKPDGFIVMNELTLRALHDPVIHAHLQWLDQGWHAYLKQILHQGREQRFFRQDLDPERAATWLILLLKSTTFHFMANPEAMAFHQIQAAIECWLLGEQEQRYTFCTIQGASLMSELSSQANITHAAPSTFRSLTLLTLLLLEVEFFMGMLVNLYVQVPAIHPGANASNYFLGVVQGVGWALVSSPLALLAHVVLGMLLGLASFLLLGLAIASRRWAWIVPALLGWIGVVGAGFNGASFLNYGHDFSSLLMSTGFVLAMISYTLGFALTGKKTTMAIFP